MRNDRLLIPVLHVAHDAKCFFAFCILAFLSTTIGQLCFITKIPMFGLYEYKVRGRAVGSIEIRASLRRIHNLSQGLACFDRADSLHHNLSVIFSFLHSYDKKNRQKLSIAYVINCPV